MPLWAFSKVAAKGPSCSPKIHAVELRHQQEPWPKMHPPVVQGMQVRCLPLRWHHHHGLPSCSPRFTGIPKKGCCVKFARSYGSAQPGKCSGLCSLRRACLGKPMMKQWPLTGDKYIFCFLFAFESFQQVYARFPFRRNQLPMKVAIRRFFSPWLG